MLISAELSVILFGLLASLSFGSGDFCGGLATKRLPAVSVVAVGHLAGLVVLLALALLTGEMLPTGIDLLWGTLAGLAGALGLGCFYQALSLGRMGLAAPVVAVAAVIVPVAFGLFTRGLPAATQVLGFVLGMVSLWLVSYSEGQMPDRRILMLALLAGIGFGGFFILIANVESQGLFWPLAAARTASALASLTLVRLTHQPWRPASRGLLLTIIMAGALDVCGNAFYMLAERAGRLDIAAVVSSLYPAVTAILAWLMLKEHLRRGQLVGIGLAVVAIILISL